MLVTTALSAYAGVTVLSSLFRTAVAVSSKTVKQSISFELNDRKIATDNKFVIGALSVLFSPVTEPFFWYAHYKRFK
jgi:hypothetical protein